jgi:IclR family acetate operon transcriptional repressor
MPDAVPSPLADPGPRWFHAGDQPFLGESSLMTSARAHAAETQPLKATKRTLDVLEFVGQQGYPVTAARIGEACGIPRSSLYKLLRVLEERGYLAGLPGDGGWTSGQRLLDLRADSLLFVHGMLVLEALERGGGRLGVEDLAAAAELPRELVERTLAALAAYGLVMPGYDGTYALGLRFVSMAPRVGWAERLQLAARPLLVRLRDETGETASLIVEDAGQALYLDQIESHFELRCRGWVGRRVPLDGTSVGAAFADALHDAHVVDDAVEHGVTAVSCAVSGVDPRAGVNVIGPTWRLEERGRDAVAELVRAAAIELAEVCAATLSPAL